MSDDYEEGTVTEGTDMDDPSIDASPPEDISEATEQGWVPKEQWHGNPDQWVPASEFVRRGREILPILRKNLSLKDQRIAQLEAKNAALQAKMDSFDTFKGNLEQTIYERALNDVKAQVRQATIDGDAEALADAQERLEELRNAPPPKPSAAPTTQAASLPPAVQSWMVSNPWYSDANPDLVGYANGVAQQMVRDAQSRGEAVDQSMILARTTQRVKQAFPQRFGASPSFDGGSPNGGGRPQAGAGGKGFASLPADAKAVFARLYRDGAYKGKKVEEAQAQYLKDYNS